MGNSRWNSGSYDNYSRSVSSKTREEIFSSTDCKDELNPAKIKVRESCDSEANPNSTPVIIGVDDTGSMGYLAEAIIRKALGVVVQGIYDRKPVTDPHVLLAAIGDTNCDRYPLQVTQFEADVKLVEQLSNFYIEQGGGGNGGESYLAMWWFALNKTVCDAITKRGRKGYLFTIGDEAPHDRLFKNHIKDFFNGTASDDIRIQDLLRDVQEHWNVFHLITPTSTTRAQNAVAKWRELLGENAVVVEDYEKLGEVIVSTMQLNEGADLDTACSGYDSSTEIVVKKAVSGLAKKSGTGKGHEVVKV